MIRIGENTANTYPGYDSKKAPPRPGYRRFLLWHLVVGFFSLLWFVLRVGTKPSRIQYPCQRVAAPLASGFVLYVLGLLSSFAVYKKYRLLVRRMGRRAAVACLCVAVGVFAALLSVRVGNVLGISDPVHTHSPIGTGSPTVVSVYDEDATSWSGESYYWNYVDQDVVNAMLSQAVTALTGTSTTNEAWQDILPDYTSGKTIALKVNFNNGGATDLNSLPQPVVALINQLKQFGFAGSDIYVYDTSRPISSGNPDSIHYVFRSAVQGTGATIVDVDTPGGWSTNQFSTYSTLHGTVSTPYAQLLDDVDYVVNFPIMRAHGISGVTFGFKNHYGSIQQIMFGFGAPLHEGIEEAHSGYSATGVPLVDLNSLSVIRDKTVLVVGDGIYSHSSSNTEPPNLNPEVILMSKDPVAADSVMFDYLHTLSSRAVWHQSQISYVELTGGADTYTLTVNVVGSGSVNRNPAPPYYLDDVVTLTAVPDESWEFAGWSGAVTGSTNPISVTMNSHKTVTATFAELPPEPQVHISAPYFIEEGDTLIMTAVVQGLDGMIEYQWSKVGVGNLSGENGPSMTIEPVAESDEGYYQVEVWVGVGDHIQSEPRFVEVVPVGTIPAAGVVGLSLLISACGLAGVVAVRHKSR